MGCAQSSSKHDDAPIGVASSPVPDAAPSHVQQREVQNGGLSDDDIHGMSAAAMELQSDAGNFPAALEAYDVILAVRNPSPYAIEVQKSACFNCGLMCFMPNNDAPPDEARALEYFYRGVALGDQVGAKLYAGYLEMQRGHKQKAFDMYKESVAYVRAQGADFKMDDVDKNAYNAALAEVAVSYYYGKFGHARDVSKSYELFEEVLNSDSANAPTAFYSMALINLNFENTKLSPDEQWVLGKKLLLQGSAEGNLGASAVAGLLPLITPDPSAVEVKVSLSLLKKACAGGYQLAKTNLAMAYLYGIGCEQNLEDGEFWLLEAFKSGADAVFWREEYNIIIDPSVVEAKGVGVLTTALLGLNLFTSTPSEQLPTPLMLNQLLLAHKLEFGWLCRRDLESALKWYRAVKERGLSLADQLIARVQAKLANPESLPPVDEALKRFEADENLVDMSVGDRDVETVLVLAPLPAYMS